MQAPLPRIKLRLEYGHALTLGPGKMQLLVLIDHHGSIAAAGRDMGMSYKRAWSLVEEMNAGFTLPVVDSSRGGPGGGVWAERRGEDEGGGPLMGVTSLG
jgi:molybdate transport system regulatory protein